jgi:O-antigen ligase
MVGFFVLVASVGAALQVLPLGQRIREFAAETGGEVSQVDRLVAWRASLAMAADFPVSGVGFGSLPDAFGRYLPAGEAKRWEHLHNDYLEVAVEGGVIAAVLSVWLLVGFWRRAATGLGTRSAEAPDPAAVGLLLGLAALSIHAAVDFNHQIPADALLFTTAAAIAVARGERAAGRSS